MSKLLELMERGFRIQISEMIPPGTEFSYTDPENDWAQEEHRTLVFHPLDYSYIAYEDIWEAHEVNMNWIEARIDRMAKEANEKLYRMVYEMNHRNDPVLISFFPNTEVIGNEDGTFTFSAQPYIEGAVNPSLIFVGGPEPSSQFMADQREKALAWLEHSDATFADQPVEQTWDELLHGYKGE